jgi:ankyrin repeat protein
MLAYIEFLGLADTVLYAPLDVACRIGNIAAIALLLGAGANPNCIPFLRKETPLHTAAIEGNLEAVELLLAHGANPNARNSVGFTPFHSAVEGGQIATVEMLLQHAANVNTRNINGYTPLHYAASNGTLELVELLLKAGATPTAVDHNNRTPLHYASCNRSDKSFAIVETLIRNGGNVNAKTRWGETPLHISARHSHYNLPLKALLALGADIQSLDDDGKTPCEMDVKDEAAIILYKHWLSKVAGIGAADLNYRSVLDLRNMYLYRSKILAAKLPRFPPS